MEPSSHGVPPRRSERIRSGSRGKRELPGADSHPGPASAGDVKAR
ncbi:hypothetical protein DUI70_1023 [Streptomyces albus]|nr:hypothetical protein DUI70_1023 [Streptomyces albus]